MKAENTLVVFYSMNGTTQEVAEVLAKRIGCRIEEIKTERYPAGWRGYLRASWDALTKATVPIHSMDEEPRNYDLVIVGGPVWDSSLANPVRTYLHRHRNQFRDVAFFVTHGGSGANRVFRQMREACGKAPVSTLSCRTQEVLDKSYQKSVEDFVETMTKADYLRAG